MRGRPNRASRKAKQLDFKGVFLEEQELKERLPLAGGSVLTNDTEKE